VTLLSCLAELRNVNNSYSVVEAFFALLGLPFSNVHVQPNADERTRWPVLGAGRLGQVVEGHGNQRVYAVSQYKLSVF